VDMLLKQSTEQINPKPFSDKMSGHVIITPDCIGEFINYIVSSFLSDYALISGNSIFKEKLNKSVADSKFTLHSKPVSDEIADNYFFTSDGYKRKIVLLLKTAF